MEENKNGLSPMQIFPNPVQESATLQFSSEVKNAALTLTDLNGKEVVHISNISGTAYYFERNEIAAGIYFFSLTESGKIISVSKIIFE
jgi:hypothetical protein